MVANCYEKLHNYDKALKIKNHIYELFLENRGADDSDTIRALNSLTWCYQLAERSPEGIEYSEMLEDYYSQHNEITVARIIHLDTVAIVYAEGGKIERAIEIAEELIEDTISTFPENLKSLGTRYYTAALVYLLAGNLGKAADYAEKSYNIRKDLGNNEETDESMKLINRIKS